MRLFLAIAAVLAWWFGAMLILIPGDFYAPTQAAGEQHDFSGFCRIGAFECGNLGTPM